MSQVWVPWQENPERFKLRGFLKGVAWAPLLMVYGLFKRFPATLFYGGGVVLCLIIWMHAELFAFLETNFLLDAGVNTAAEVSVFGGDRAGRATALGFLRDSCQHPGDVWPFHILGRLDVLLPHQQVDLSEVITVMPEDRPQQPHHRVVATDKRHTLIQLGLGELFEQRPAARVR